MLFVGPRVERTDDGISRFCRGAVPVCQALAWLDMVAAHQHPYCGDISRAAGTGAFGWSYHPTFSEQYFSAYADILGLAIYLG